MSGPKDAPRAGRWPTVTGARVLLASGLALAGGALVVLAGPYQGLRTAAGRPLPEELSTTPAAVAAFLAGLDAGGRARYAAFQYLDFLNPLLLSLAAAALLLWLSARARLPVAAGRAMLLFPAALALADVTENLLLLGAIARYPEAGPLAEVLPWATRLKFAALLLVPPVALVLGGLAVLRRRAGTGR